MSCRLFPEETKLVKAHIFPKWQFEDLKRGSSYLWQIPSDGGRKKKSRIGVYDSNILSGRAEKYLSQYDSYGATFFRQPLSVDFADPRLQLQIFNNKNFDFIKLKTFILSVLWRASISKRDEYAAVNLGAHFEEELRKNILSPNHDTEPFSIVAFRYKPSLTIANKEKIFATPYLSKQEGQNWYNLRVLNWRISVKVDNRPVHAQAECCVLKPDNHFIVFVDDFDASSENKSIDRMSRRFGHRRYRNLLSKG